MKNTNPSSGFETKYKFYNEETEEGKHQINKTHN